MGGMKSGTGDVWGDDGDEDEDEAVESEAESVMDSEAEAAAETADEQDDEAERVMDAGSSKRAETADSGRQQESESGSEPASEKDIAKRGSSDGGPDEEDSGSSGQPYVVRRMLKDKSVQFERDERLTFFVHDDVKTGEQELEAQTQDLFGRDIPVFDIREAVYRAALQNRDDVIQALEQMGYTRE